MTTYNFTTAAAAVPCAPPPSLARHLDTLTGRGPPDAPERGYDRLGRGTLLRRVVWWWRGGQPVLASVLPWATCGRYAAGDRSPHGEDR
jgi:hypothetical protein